MITEEEIKRINELYHKSKDSGLSAEEREEQTRLRRAYIDSVKANLGVYLKDIKNAEKPVDDDGTYADDPKEEAKRVMAETDQALKQEKHAE